MLILNGADMAFWHRREAKIVPFSLKPFRLCYNGPTTRASKMFTRRYVHIYEQCGEKRWKYRFIDLFSHAYLNTLHRLKLHSNYMDTQMFD
jgi:hypothetical protein